jgi:molybdopterin/thiamine biosynthesis adenylyltransferase
MVAKLSQDELIRYARNIKIPSIGEAGQRKLKAASVLIVGVGGLGSASALYLAAAGVGRLGLVDDDRVELSNLNRQIIHDSTRIGMPKVESAQKRLVDLNPEVKVDLFPQRFSQQNANEIVNQYSIIVDGTDNFETRYLLNKVCVEYKKPYVYGAVFQFSGQASVFNATAGPCFQCVFHDLPPIEVIAANKGPGVIGALPGTIATIQTVEVIKLILEIGIPLIGRLLILDELDMKFNEIIVKKDPNCLICKKSN